VAGKTAPPLPEEPEQATAGSRRSAATNEHRKEHGERVFMAVEGSTAGTQ